MITRTIEEELKIAAAEYPVVALLGPRQSGKTTVLKKNISKLELRFARRFG